VADQYSSKPVEQHSSKPGALLPGPTATSAVVSGILSGSAQAETGHFSKFLGRSPVFRGHAEGGTGAGPRPGPVTAGRGGPAPPPSLAYSPPGVPVGPGGSGIQVCDHATIAAMTGSRSCPLAVRRYRTCTGVSGTT